MNKTYTLFIIISIYCIHINAQFVTVKGKIMNSTNVLLPYATVIADTKDSKYSSYSISNDKGAFNLRVRKNSLYIITASYLGYKPKTISTKFSKDSTINFILFEEEENLEEITIKYSPPIIVKKDTIKYKVDKFITGEERKLKDILNKLPGIEVDRAGNVVVHGKKVTKVLVENKQFFTGDSKLAVNNIPADAVNEIEVLDNYNDITILKGLEDSNDLAINIKLKKNKQKFWFGGVETGSGVGHSERYLVHPSIFYYSPKTSLNFIGDINNIGVKSFTFKDYLDFEGGYKKILLNPKAYFSKVNDDFSQFLSNKDFKNSEHLFEGASINQFINKKTDLIGYIIYSNSNNEQESRNVNEYLENNSSLIENRITTNNTINNFIIGKIGIDNTQIDGTKLKIQSFFKSSNNKNNILNTSTISNGTNFINTFSKSNNVDFKQNIEWHKNLSQNHTISAIGSFNFMKGDVFINWTADDNIFQSIIPITDDSEYSIFKDKETSSLNFSSLIKHYWVLGNFIHLYTTIGIQNYDDNYKTNEYQQISNGTINNFSSSDFGNDIEFNFNNLYLGSYLKFQKGKFTFKPGVFYHNYSRKVTQLNQELQLDKNYLLPELSIKIDLKRNEKLSIRYNRKVRFPSITKLLNNFTLTNFNSIYKGNPNLENELYHKVSIYYYKFSLFKRISYNFTINYRKTEKGIKNSNTLFNINYITQPILLDNSDRNFNFSGSINKRFGRYRLSLGNNSIFSNYLQQINGTLRKNKSVNYSFYIGLKTTFNNFPNFNFNYKKTFNNYKTQISTSNFESDFIDLNIDYDFWNDFIFNLNYNYQYFKNKNTNSINQNNLLNMSIFYKKEKSPWGFELSANNLFNNKFIRNSSFSDFLITDNKKFILPRIIMLKLSYKL